MRQVEKNGLSPDIVKFVAPLGATVNMNGTALYEASTVIFLAQVGHPTPFFSTFFTTFLPATHLPEYGTCTRICAHICWCWHAFLNM